MNYIISSTNKKVTLPKKGYFSKGDEGEDVEIIASFLAVNFLGYEYKTKVKADDILGRFYGKNIETWVKQFQRNNNLKDDGCIGNITLNKLKEYGLNAW